MVLKNLKNGTAAVELSKRFLEHVCCLFCQWSLWSLCAIYFRSCVHSKYIHILIVYCYLGAAVEIY
jgi:hypothetical protein